MPAVYNIKWGDAPAGAVYCGRGTKYGNPFVIGYMWRGKRMTREVALTRFFMEVLPNLDVSELRGKDLLCHCAPLRCHCDFILEKANRVLEKSFTGGRWGDAAHFFIEGGYIQIVPHVQNEIIDALTLLHVIGDAKLAMIKLEQFSNIWVGRPYTEWSKRYDQEEGSKEEGRGEKEEGRRASGS
jgi:hypothetical protein